MRRERGHKPEVEIDIPPERMIGFIQLSRQELDLIGLKDIALKYTCRTLNQEEKDLIFQMLKSLGNRLADDPLRKKDFEEIIDLYSKKFKLVPESVVPGLS